MFAFVASALAGQLSHASFRPSVSPSINIYSGCLVSAPSLTVLYWSFWNFACVFFMVWGCACALDIIVRLFNVTFSTLWTVIFHPSYIDIGYICTSCDHNSSHRFVLILLKLCICFFMVWGVQCSLDIIVRLFLSLFPHCEPSHFSPSV